MKQLRLFLVSVAAVLIAASSSHAARNFASASSNRITCAGLPVAAKPFSVFLWFKTPTAGSGTVLFAFAKTTGGGSENQAWLRFNGTPALQVLQYINGSLTAITSSNTVTTSAWQSAGAVFASSGNSSVWLNGTETTGTITTSMPVNLDSVVLGRYTDVFGSGSSYYNGDEAEVAVWSVALTADEFAALNSGACPLQVRPSSLVYYAPLVRNVQEIRGGRTLTDSGTSVADHPRIYR